MAENYITTQEEKGSINISEDVFAVMVAAAATEVEGVSGLTNTMAGDLAEFLGIKNITKGIKVAIVDGRVVVDMIITVRFGCNITTVAKNAQKAAASAIESMTGLPSTVNVHVSGITLDK